MLDLLLQRVLALGARPARPGEFSERAFLNDKLDLAQAEAIADLIESGTAQAARAAVRSLQGVFSTRVEALIESLTRLRMYVEAAIDFPEEEIDFLADRRIAAALSGLIEQADGLLQRANTGRLLRDGMTLVIAGRPNAGKSSLMNALTGQDSAIVTHIPGTTRDAVDVICEADGVRFRFVDTAGIRRKGRTDKGPEVLSVVVARRHLERPRVCLLFIRHNLDLVGGDSLFETTFRKRTRTREMEIAEKDLPGPELCDLLVEWLLDLDDELGVAIDGVGIIDYHSSRIEIVAVLVAAAKAGSCLHHDIVSVRNQQLDADRSHCDAIFVALDFSWYANFHSPAPLLLPGCLSGQTSLPDCVARTALISGTARICPTTRV